MSIYKMCGQCLGDNYIYSVEVLAKNQCRHCKAILDKNLEDVSIEAIIQEGYKKGLPDDIPASCGDCIYFKKTGILGFQSGVCDFYNEEVYPYNECVVTRIQKLFDKVAKEKNKVTIPCPSCGIRQNENALFCKDCGSEMNLKKFLKVAHCDKCETNYPLDFMFCEIDGNKLIIIEIEKGKEDQVVSVSSNSKKEKKETREIVGTDEVQEKKTKLGFVWGNIWITVCFIQSIMFLVFAFGVPQEEELIFGWFLLSVFSFSSAIGLLRRKFWGLYVTYFAIIINYGFGGLSYIDIDEPLDIFRMIALLITGVLWWIYFNKRKEMFS